MSATRNAAPEIWRIRGRLSGAARRADRKGDTEAAKKYRQELLDLDDLAAARKVAADLDDLTFEVAEQIRALFGRA